jgi:hypothetical protein
MIACTEPQPGIFVVTVSGRLDRASFEKAIGPIERACDAARALVFDVTAADPSGLRYVSSFVALVRRKQNAIRTQVGGVAILVGSTWARDAIACAFSAFPPVGEYMVTDDSGAAASFAMRVSSSETKAC